MSDDPLAALSEITADALDDVCPATMTALVELGGDCVCGRGPTVGTCTWTSGRLAFRAFHDGPAPFHLANATDWACVDCVADATMAVATGQVREAMRNITRQRAGLLEAPDA